MERVRGNGWTDFVTSAPPDWRFAFIINLPFERGNTALGVGEAKAREESIFYLSSFVYGSDHLNSNFLVLDWGASLQNHMGVVVTYDHDILIEQIGARVHKLSSHRVD